MIVLSASTIQQYVCRIFKLPSVNFSQHILGFRLRRRARYSACAQPTRRTTTRGFNIAHVARAFDHPSFNVSLPGTVFLCGRTEGMHACGPFEFNLTSSQRCRTLRLSTRPIGRSGQSFTGWKRSPSILGGAGLGRNTGTRTTRSSGKPSANSPQKKSSMLSTPFGQAHWTFVLNQVSARTHPWLLFSAPFGPGLLRSWLCIFICTRGDKHKHTLAIFGPRQGGRNLNRIHSFGALLLHANKPVTP